MFKKRNYRYYMTFVITLGDSTPTYFNRTISVPKKLNTPEIIQSVVEQVEKNELKDYKGEHTGLVLINFKYLGRVRVDTK